MALNFKFLLLFALLFAGCNNTKKESNTTNNETQVSKKTEIQKQESTTELEISKLEAQNKLDIAKVQAQNLLEVEKVKASTTKDIALADVRSKSEDTKLMIYIAVIVGLLLLVLIWLIYLGGKKRTDAKLKIHEAELKQKKEIAERELEEKRLENLVSLVTHDKLSKEMQKELLSLIDKKSNLVIESKDS